MINGSKRIALMINGIHNVWDYIFTYKYNNGCGSIGICVIIFGCLSFVIIHGSRRIALMIVGIHGAWDYISTSKYKNWLRSIQICVITFRFLPYMMIHASGRIALMINKLHRHEIIYPHWNIRSHDFVTGGSPLRALTRGWMKRKTNKRKSQMNSRTVEGLGQSYSSEETEI